MLEAPADQSSELAYIFPGGSEMALRMRAFDWSTTDLNAPNPWPQNLRTALGICLNSPLPLHIWWGPSLTLFYNDAAIAFLGPGKHPSVIGHSGREAWAEIWENIGPIIKSVQTTGTASRSEELLIFSVQELAQKEVYVSFSFSPIFGADGRVEGLFGVVTESTEKMVGAAGLREHAQLLRYVTQSIPGGSLSIFDKDLRYLFAEGQGLAQVGLASEQLVGKTLAESFSRESVDEVTPYYRRAFAGETVEFDLEVAGRWYVIRVSPLRDEQGSINAVIALSLDITDRKTVEAALRESEERLRLVLESVRDYAIFTMDPVGRVTSWNEGAHRLTHYTLEEILDQPVARFYIPEDVVAAKLAHEMETALRVGRFEDEGWRVRKDGARLWVNEIMTPLYADDGTHLGFTKVSRDLTTRKEAEVMVAGALAQAQQARVEAEAALETRQQFLSIASHELRTPMTTLMGYADLLPRALMQGKGDAVKMTAVIMRQAQRLDTLIEQLLDVSRLQRGQFAIEQQAVDVATLVRQVVDEFRAAQSPTTKHAVELRCPDEAVVVMGDASRLEQVLQNLLSNAVKYSPAGGPVRVRVMTTTTAAVLEVADEGIGIPAEAQAHLFEAFYRADNVGPQLSGFGLGLHIVEEIVQRHGGRIEVESSEGAGSSFRVVLPRVAAVS